MTKIEWTKDTWNPTVGCSLASPGCTNCYAMAMAYRLANIAMTRDQYANLTTKTKAGAVWTGIVRLWEPALDKPLKRLKPTTYFVNSMSDLFHEALRDAAIDQVFDVMERTPRHTYQVLTKRADRMARYTQSRYSDPPPHIWLGVSTEDQRRADDRIPHLLKARAAIRFLSCEPLLGPLALTPWLHGLDWVIAGAESGKGARPMDLNWVRSLRDQCVNAGVAFFFKQDAEGGHKVSLPELDGQRWTQQPVHGASVNTSCKDQCDMFS